MGNKGIDIIIPQDIRDYKAKAFGPFTIRQSITIIIMTILVFGTLGIQKSLLGIPHPTLMPALFICPIPALFGFGDKLVGMPMEVYLKRVMVSAFIAPRHRVYVSHSYFDIMEDKMEEIRQAEEKEKARNEAKMNKKNKVKKQEQKPKVNSKNLPPELRPYD